MTSFHYFSPRKLQIETFAIYTEHNWSSFGHSIIELSTMEKLIEPATNLEETVYIVKYLSVTR